MSYRIPFNRPYVVGDELAAVARSVADGQIGGDGPFTRECQELLERAFGAHRDPLITPSPETPYVELFRTIVNTTPAPYGLGEAA